MTLSITLDWLDLLWLVPASLAFMFYGYVFTMGVKARFKQLPRIAQAAAIPPVIFAFLLDILLNVVLLTLLFRELPTEVTITHRMRRWKTMGATHPRRAKLAGRICKVLNLFDEGHC